MSSIFFSDTSKDFIKRHIGSSPVQTAEMLQQLGVSSVNELINETVPAGIQLNQPLPIDKDTLSEQAFLKQAKSYALQNKLHDCYLGMGFYPTHTPSVILRNIFENPSWYTAYTPYQPEIAQGRLEALTNFQQMVMDLTQMPLANASLLDEATAAAEAMAMSQRIVKKNKSLHYFVDQYCHPQTINVIKTRAEHFGFNLIIGDINKELNEHEIFGALIQYPDTLGTVNDLSPIIESIHQKNAIATVATDLLSLCLLKAPGEMGADIVVGNSQRFGVPMGYGGPHAAFFACSEAHKRAMPGRIIGLSKDSQKKPAYRMAMQTREQHIRREKATSNICTSQALLAIMASFYAIYHGASGLKAIATRIHNTTQFLARALEEIGFEVVNTSYFDTISIKTEQAPSIHQKALSQQVNLRLIDDQHIGISLHECLDEQAFIKLLRVFGIEETAFESSTTIAIPENLQRSTEFLTHPVFNQYQSETELMRYMRRLENKDVALNHSMISLGSCTMKLNAATEMLPVSWPEFAHLHPYVPKDQAAGYQAIFNELIEMLKAVTGYDAISLQPNAGSQGEYAGLLAIKSYFESKNESHRNICLIPSSAHGTNPASAAMAGMKVVIINCDSEGNVDIDDLKQKVALYQENIACLMVTYPSTHGVFEEGIQDICELIHEAGGQVYVDGANMNALVGIAAPGKFGADVSHLNLHKTFAIPHGGGGPGMGPIGVKSHLAPFLPGNPTNTAEKTSISATEYGSASILLISWAYLSLLGKEGLKQSTEMAIVQANYIAHRLKPYYPILYSGIHGRVAHECLIDIRSIKSLSGISEEDIAKRLVDFGFHAPTMSFPVAGTLMIEPTESESKAEIDRFCDSMIQIHQEIKKVTDGFWPLENNPLVNAPHTHERLTANDWPHPYTREEAAYPLSFVKANKYWPPVGRVDNVYGDRNLFCACPPIENY